MSEITEVESVLADVTNSYIPVRLSTDEGSLVKVPCPRAPVRMSTQ